MHLETESGTRIASPTEAEVRRVVESLDIEDITYAILTHSSLTYMQTMRLEDGFELEYQDGSTDNHYQAERLLTADEVVAAMTRYAVDDPAWKSMFAWQKLDLPTTTKKGCASAVLLVVGGAATLAAFNWLL